MPNRNYIKGRNKEYIVRTKLKQKGWDIVQRTAGSHSPIDLFAIKAQERRIKLIQCKPTKISERAKNKLLKENIKLNGLFIVEFEVI